MPRHRIKINVFWFTNVKMLYGSGGMQYHALDFQPSFKGRCEMDQF